MLPPPPPVGISLKETGRGMGKVERRAEAVDVINAPAERFCGSGVSTSVEKSMAAAVAVLAFSPTCFPPSRSLVGGVW